MADKRSSNTATTTTRKPTKTARPKQSVVASTPKQRSYITSIPKTFDELWNGMKAKLREDWITNEGVFNKDKWIQKIKEIKPTVRFLWDSCKPERELAKKRGDLSF